MAEGTTTALIARAQAFGLKLEYRSGFLTVARSELADRRREDLVEMEQEIIEQLGKRLTEVRASVIATARVARGKEFIGRRVFIPLVGIGDAGSGGEGQTTRSQISGKLVGWSEEGTLTVSHVEKYGLAGHHRGAVERTGTCGWDEAFMVVDGGDQPDRASSFASIGSEKIRRALERGESIGLTLALDAGGFAVATWNVAPEDRDAGEEILRELGRPKGGLLGVLETRASGAAGSAFVGQRVRVFDSFGVLQSCDPDGHLDVTYEDKHLGSRLTCSCGAADLLILLDPEEAGRSANPESSPAAKNWLKRAFGR